MILHIRTNPECSCHFAPALNYPRGRHPWEEGRVSTSKREGNRPECNAAPGHVGLECEETDLSQKTSVSIIALA